MNEPQPPIEAPGPRMPVGFLVGWTILGLATYLVAGGLVQFAHLAFGLWFGELLLFVGAAVLGWQLLSFSSSRAMGVSRFEPRAFGIGVVFGLVNYVAWALPTMAAAQKIFPKSLVELFDSSRIFERQTPIELALIIAGVSIAAPWGEEFFFRGFLQRGLSEHVPAPRAIVVTAVIFSAFHLDPVGFVARFELGVLFGLLAWKSGSLWPAMGAHAANNALSSALFLAARDSAHADDELAWYIPLGFFIVGNVAMLGLVRALGPRLTVKEPNDFVDVAPRPIAARVSPWLIGGVIALAGLALIDRRGVALNIVDGLAQAPKEIRNRADIVELRARVRSGEAELSEYRDLLNSANVK